ncbi:hypothetical protein C8255_04630 [filamentous cyanobacterium CCP3]|nr:hypothetical protein C8255_04630 [filamentous cyanobacterium CCP3]
MTTFIAWQQIAAMGISATTSMHLLSRVRLQALISGLANSNVGWVSDSVTHAGVGFRASTQPTSTVAAD